MDSDELRALLAVGATGSYHAAARSLGFSRSTLRRRIGELEARIGRELVHVTDSGVVLTAAGANVARRGQSVLREIQAMLAQLRMEGDEPTGELRLGAPLGIPPQVFHPTISLVRARFPRVSVRLRFFEDPARAPDNEIDAYTDFGQLPPPPGWLSYDLHPVHEVLMASAAYLNRRGVPATIDDLADHDLLTWLPPDREPASWPAADGTRFPVKPVVICADNHVLHHMAVAGAGIALMLHTDLHLPGIESATRGLTPVLPELVRETRVLRLRMSEELASLPAFRAFLDSVQRFGQQIMALPGK